MANLKRNKWGNDDVESSRTGSDARHNRSNPGRKMVQPDAVVGDLRKTLCKFWSEHGSGFKEMWSELSVDERKMLIRT
eukprot:2873047-Rhodomonas_salina.1